MNCSKLTEQSLLFDCRDCGRRNTLYFRPALIYLPILDDHVAEAGLDFRINLSTGLKEARFPSNLDIDVDSERYSTILSELVQCVPDSERKSDFYYVKEELLKLARSGQVEKVAMCIRTCYVTRGMATELLVECAGDQGLNAFTAVLLRAGANPALPLSAFGSKTALHVACDNGNEELAKQCIDGLTTVDASVALLLRADGLTALDMCERNDCMPMKRRLLQAAQARGLPCPK